MGGVKKERDIIPREAHTKKVIPLLKAVIAAAL